MKKKVFKLKFFILTLLYLACETKGFGSDVKAVCIRINSGLFDCQMQKKNVRTFRTTVRVVEASTQTKVDLYAKYARQVLTTKYGNGPGSGRVGTWSSEGINRLLKPSRGIKNRLIESINNLYTQRNQRNALEQQCPGFGRQITSSHFFAKGHLAANADYNKTEYKLSTFHYLNAAPQWQPFNNGNWRRVEAHVQRLVKRSNGEVFKVFTGTFGNMRCFNDSTKSLYIKNGGTVSQSKVGVSIRIPKIFYKIVVPDKQIYPQGKYVLIAVVNDPTLNKGQIEADSEFRICSEARDICDKIHFDNAYKWFKSTGFNCDKRGGSVTRFARGFMYMCEATNELKMRLGIRQPL